MDLDKDWQAKPGKLRRLCDEFSRQVHDLKQEPSNLTIQRQSLDQKIENFDHQMRGRQNDCKLFGLDKERKAWAIERGKINMALYEHKNAIEFRENKILEYKEEIKNGTLPLLGEKKPQGSPAPIGQSGHGLSTNWWVESFGPK